MGATKKDFDSCVAIHPVSTLTGISDSKLTAGRRVQKSWLLCVRSIDKQIIDLHKDNIIPTTADPSYMKKLSLCRFLQSLKMQRESLPSRLPRL